MDHKKNIEQALSYIDWHDLDQHTQEEMKKMNTSPAKENKQNTHLPQNIKGMSNLPPYENILASNIATDICQQFGVRITSLGISSRQAEDAKKGLVNKDLIKEVFLGKSLFLRPTENLYQLFGLPSPYKRNVSEEHSFFVLLTSKLVEIHPLVQTVKTEASLGDVNCTVDLVANLKDGSKFAYEVTLNVSNVCANAAKLQGKGFAQIIFVCRDYNLKQGVWASIRNAGFDPDFLATIRCTIFSSLIQQRKKMVLGK